MADSETTKMNLQHEVTVNGVKYPAGTNVSVPKDQADDIARLDYDHQQYKNNLMRKQTYEVNSGTIPMGGGAQ